MKDFDRSSISLLVIYFVTLVVQCLVPVADANRTASTDWVRPERTQRVLAVLEAPAVDGRSESERNEERDAPLSGLRRPR